MCLAGLEVLRRGKRTEIGSGQHGMRIPWVIQGETFPLPGKHLGEAARPVGWVGGRTGGTNMLPCFLA